MNASESKEADGLKEVAEFLYLCSKVWQLGHTPGRIAELSRGAFKQVAGLLVLYELDPGDSKGATTFQIDKVWNK